MFSYFESRGGKFSEVVFFGLQYIIKVCITTLKLHYLWFTRPLEEAFSEVSMVIILILIQKYLVGQVVTEEKLAQAKEIYDAHLGPGLFNYDGWKYILEEYGGKLPLKITAVPEGSLVPTKNGI